MQTLQIQQQVTIPQIRGDYVGLFVLGFLLGFLLCLWTARVLLRPAPVK